MRTFAFPTYFLLFVLILTGQAIFPSFAKADTISFQQLTQDQCATYTMGFKTGTGCALGRMCVMGNQNAGSEQVPTCMLIQAATVPNYTDQTACNTSCGHACTQNSDTYLGTYYCAPTTQTLPAQPTTQPLPAQPTTQPLPPQPSGTNVTLINPLGSGTSLSSFMTNILQFVINIGAIIVILMLVYVGFLFVVAQGNESKISEARNALLWTVIGALILLGAQAISLGIQATVQALGG